MIINTAESHLSNFHHSLARFCEVVAEFIDVKFSFHLKCMLCMVVKCVMWSFVGTRCLANGHVLKPKFTILAFENEPRGETQPELAS